MVDLKSLWDNSVTCVLSILASIDYPFLCKLKYLWSFMCWIILVVSWHFKHYATRFWILFKSTENVNIFVLAGNAPGGVQSEKASTWRHVSNVRLRQEVDAPIPIGWATAVHSLWQLQNINRKTIEREARPCPDKRPHNPHSLSQGDLPDLKAPWRSKKRPHRLCTGILLALELCKNTWEDPRGIPNTD